MDLLREFVFYLSHQVLDPKATYWKSMRSNAYWHLYVSMTMTEDSLRERFENINDMVMQLTRYGHVHIAEALAMDREDAQAYADSLQRLLKDESPSETLVSST